MASLDFELEKRKFRKFYDNNLSYIDETKDTYINAIETLIAESDVGEVTKIVGRIKDKESVVTNILTICFY